MEWTMGAGARCSELLDELVVMDVVLEAAQAAVERAMVVADEAEVPALALARALGGVECLLQLATTRTERALRAAKLP